MSNALNTSVAALAAILLTALSFNVLIIGPANPASSNAGMALAPVLA